MYSTIQECAIYTYRVRVYICMYTYVTAYVEIGHWSYAYYTDVSYSG